MAEVSLTDDKSILVQVMAWRRQDSVCVHNKQ